MATLETRLKTIQELESELTEARSHLGRLVLLAQQVQTDCVLAEEGPCLNTKALKEHVDALDIAFLAEMGHITTFTSRLRTKLISKVVNRG